MFLLFGAVRVLNLHRDKKLKGVNQGEMGRSFVTTGRVVMMRSIASE